MGKRELVALLCLFFRDCCVALPHDATSLSAVYDSGISLTSFRGLQFAFYINAEADNLRQCHMGNKYHGLKTRQQSPQWNVSPCLIFTLDISL